MESTQTANHVSNKWGDEDEEVEDLRNYYQDHSASGTMTKSLGTSRKDKLSIIESVRSLESASSTVYDERERELKAKKNK